MDSWPQQGIFSAIGIFANYGSRLLKTAFHSCLAEQETARQVKGDQ
jgi:hypothetical protein